VLLEFLNGLPDTNRAGRFGGFAACPFLVFFCGEVHLGYRLFNLRVSKESYIGYRDDDIYVYDLKSLEAVIEKYDKGLFKTFFDKRQKFSYYHWKVFSHDGLEKVL